MKKESKTGQINEVLECMRAVMSTVDHDPDRVLKSNLSSDPARERYPSGLIIIILLFLVLIFSMDILASFL